jgi:O-antigen ligase
MGARRRDEGRVLGSRRSDTLLTWLIVLFLIAVPFPLGSNRPVFWALNGALVALLGLGYCIFWAIRYDRLRVSLGQLGVLPWAFGALCLYLVAQVLPFPGMQPISVAPGSTFLMFMRMLTYGIFFFLVLQTAREPRRAGLVLDLLLCGLTLHALSGMFLLRTGDTLLGFEKTSYLGSATGTFVNRNSFATLLAFGCTLAFALLLESFKNRSSKDHPVDRSWARVALYATALVTITATLFATQSRMGVLAALLGVFAVGLRSLSTDLLFRRSIVLAVVAILASLFVVIALNSEGLMQRLLSSEQSSGERLELYRQVLKLIVQRPLTGFGGGSFQLAFQSVHEPPVGVDRVWDKAHNSYLTLLSELGLIVGAIIPILIGALTWRLLRLSKSAEVNRIALTVALGVIVVAATHSLVDFSLEIQGVTFWFVALVAIGIAQTTGNNSVASALDDPDSIAGQPYGGQGSGGEGRSV